MQPYNYHIHGNDLQMLSVNLAPGQTLVCQYSAMTYKCANIIFEAKPADSASLKKSIFKKFTSALSRKLAGETFFMGHLTNTGSSPSECGVSATYPGAVIPVNVGGDSSIQSINCQRNAFLASMGDIGIKFKLINSVSGTFFGGEGLVMQRISGEGMAFIHGGGTIITKKIENEEIVVESGSLIGYTDGIEFSAVPVGRAKEMIFGGEGLFVSKLKGTGTVWIQSIPLETQMREIVDFFANNPKKLPPR
jgi:uncharacterized protein (TIGR00266 family)